MNGQMGRPWLINGVTAPALCLATLGAAKAAIQGIYYAIQGGSTSTNGFQGTLNRMAEDAVLWGTTGAVYGTTRYCLEHVNRDLMDDFLASTVASVVIITMVHMNNDVLGMESFVLGLVTGFACSAYNRATGK